MNLMCNKETRKEEEKKEVVKDEDFVKKGEVKTSIIFFSFAEKMSPD